MIKGFTDTYYTYKLLKILSARWEDTPAFKAGIIDKNGYKIEEDVLTPEQEKVYRSFDRVAYNLKRVISKVPFSQNPFIRFATAIALLKESDLTEEEIDAMIDDLEEDTPVNTSGGGHVAYTDTPMKKKKVLSRFGETSK